MMPLREIRPLVGLMPTMPLADDGPRIEPPVSEPRPSGENQAARPAPVPP